MPSTQPFPKLNDTNYNEWSFFMESWLVKAGVWDVVSGEEMMPVGSKNSKVVQAYMKRRDLAKAELRLGCEPGQHAHMHSNDPKEIWDNLARVHRARGLGSRLALKARFLFLKKKDDQPMQAWISTVREAAYQLTDDKHGEVPEEDIILILTRGLPPSYDNLVVSLDSLPSDDITLDNVITRLLNEETRQLGPIDPQSSDATVMIAKRTHTSDKARMVTCFNCGLKGHYAAGCPEDRRNNSDEAHIATTAIEKDFEVFGW